MIHSDLSHQGHLRVLLLSLGTEISTIIDFVSRVYPDPADPKHLKYPPYNLLPLQGIIEEDELRCPQMLNPDVEPSPIVTKNGCTTGLTIGRTTGAKSFVRGECFPNDRQETSMEWTILLYDHKSGAFSAPGDSGAIIVDGNGRVGGLSLAVPG